ESIKNRIAAPEGFKRVEVSTNTFDHWLRNMPLKKGKPVVYLYDGALKNNQQAQYAVVDIDIGCKNLQQCADAVIRLRAEYLFTQKRLSQIHFNFTSGDKADFSEWIKGYRPKVRGNKVKWRLTANKDSSYRNFRKYLETVFMYAGSYSLRKELQEVESLEDIKIGDVFIQGGFPGHAVIVVDMAVQIETGKKLVLLAQSYMPAQDIHILKNPINRDSNPWFEIKGRDKLYTPEWTFEWSDLRRFWEDK
ncbi:MAG: DUF4846 domain-containing protein, partial [Calditrichales bacterium]|nr:DUF4846 domain-containing protein [Calditrichales bacterium]